jgi:carboxyl-terminal processing protease
MTTIQTIFPLRGQAGIKITSAKFLRPSGQNITEAGVTPDIAQENPADDVPGSPSDDRLVLQALRQLRPSTD